MTTADALAASRASHDAYRQCVRTYPHSPEKHQHLWDAFTLRETAHALDPDHRDLAWSADKVPHAELVAFYRQQLGLPAATKKAVVVVVVDGQPASTIETPLAARIRG